VAKQGVVVYREDADCYGFVAHEPDLFLRNIQERISLLFV
jgi:hypothetical protein